MKKEQVLKILKVAIVCTIIILVSEAIFDIPVIKNWFSNLITGSTGIVFWIIIWLIMFLQVTILNIPAYVILSACTSIGVETLSFLYIGVVLSAYMCGCLLAYYLGYKFGKKAVKWCAGSEDDYEKWSKYLNEKGKIWYLLTVMFPFFPDDLLCIVAGAVKLNFGWYTLANFIGRGDGLVTIIIVLKFINFISGDFPLMLIVWTVALVAEIVLYYVVKNKKNWSFKRKKVSQANAENATIENKKEPENVLKEATTETNKNETKEQKSE